MATLITKRNGTIKPKKIVLEKLKSLETKITSSNLNTNDKTKFDIVNWKNNIRKNTKFNLQLCNGTLKKPIGGISRPLFGDDVDFEIKKLNFLINFYKYNCIEINRLKHIVKSSLNVYMEEMIIAFLKKQISKEEFNNCLQFLEYIYQPKIQAINITYKLYNASIKNCKSKVNDLQKK